MINYFLKINFSSFLFMKYECPPIHLTLLYRQAQFLPRDEMLAWLDKPTYGKY